MKLIGKENDCNGAEILIFESGNKIYRKSKSEERNDRITKKDYVKNFKNAAFKLQQKDGNLIFRNKKCKFYTTCTQRHSFIQDEYKFKITFLAMIFEWILYIKKRRNH